MRHPHFVLICLGVAIGAGVWGLYWLPQRLFLSAGMTGGWGTVAQYGISFAALTPIAIWRVLNGKEIGLRHWACGLMLGSGAIFYANSFLVTDVIRALVFFYLTPLWATIVEGVFLRRRPQWPRAVTLGFALAGVWITVGRDVGVPIPVNLGDWFGLIGGILIVAGAARTEVEQPNGLFPLMFNILFFSVVAAIGQYPLLIDELGHIPSVEVVQSSLPYLIGISLLFVLPTMILLFLAPAKIGTGVFGILILTELVVGVISAALLTDEEFGWREVLGTTLILVAGILEVVLSRSLPLAGAPAAHKT